VSKAQQNALGQEATQAHTAEDLDKVQNKAIDLEKAGQLHSDSMATIAATKNNERTNKGLDANEKLWTDPQHGYQTVARSIDATKQVIVAGANGNGLAASFAPTMEVLGINSFNQTHRVSPSEATAAGAPGGWAEQFNAWSTKAASGKLSPQLAQEGQQLMDMLKASAYKTTVQSSAMVARGHKIAPSDVPVFDQNGNLTTLDKATGQAPHPSGNQQSLQNKLLQKHSN
jgi:hypothetical protein